MPATDTIHLDVVPRLRLTFWLIGLLLTIAALTSSILLAKLQKSQKQAITHSVPTLEQSHKMVGLLARISGNATRVTTESSLTRLDNWATEINRDTDLLTEALRWQPTIESALKASRSSSIAELDVLTATAQNIAQLKRRILELDAYIKISANELATSRHNYVVNKEPDYLEATSRLSRSIEQLAGSSSNDAETAVKEIKKDISNQYGVMELSFRITDLMDLAEQTIFKTTINDILAAKLAVEQGFRNVTQLLTNLTDNTQKSKHAVILKNVRHSTLGQNGLIANVYKRAVLRDKLASEHIAYLNLAGELAQHTEIQTCSDT